MERINLMKELVSTLMNTDDEHIITDVHQKACCLMRNLEMQTADQSYSPAEEAIIADNIKGRLDEIYTDSEAAYAQQKFRRLHKALQLQDTVTNRAITMQTLLKLSSFPTSNNTNALISSISTNSPISTSSSATIDFGLSSSRSSSFASAVTTVESTVKYNYSRHDALPSLGTPFTAKPLASSSLKAVRDHASMSIPVKLSARPGPVFLSSNNSSPTYNTSSVTGACLSESELIRNLIYAFQGFTGDVVVNDDSNDGFKLNPSINVRNPSVLCQLMELASLHRYVRDQAKILQSSGNQNIVLCAIGHAIEKELHVYYHDVATIHAQVEKENDIQHDTPLSESGDNPKERVTLLQLIYWSEPHLIPFRFFGGLIDKIVETQNGVKITSILAKRAHSGNDELGELNNRLLAAATRPIYNQICYWMINGKLIDNNQDDFFIKYNIDVSERREWDKQFVINEPMVPTFMNNKLVEQILKTGHYVYFLHNVCGETVSLTKSQKILQHSKENEPPADLLPLLRESNELSELIENACNECSKIVLNVLNEKFNFQLHFKALRLYMLLGQGDFAHRLMEALETNLNQSAHAIDKYSLQNALGTATELDQNVLSRLHIKLLEACDTDIGWDTFSLEYTLDGPLNTIFKFGNGEYARIFTFLWRIKRAEYFLSRKWRDVTLLFKRVISYIPETRSVFMFVCATIKQMLGFCNHFQYYMAFQIVEASWLNFQKEVAKMESLDKIVQAHNGFLKNILTGCMLNDDLMKVKIRCLLDNVLEFVPIVETLLNNIENQLKTHTEYEQSTEKFGTCDKKEAEFNRMKTTFSNSIKMSGSKVRQIVFTFQESLCSFLTDLVHNDKCDNQMLGHQIDFNEYYKKRNETLNKSVKFGARFDATLANFTFTL